MSGAAYDEHGYIYRGRVYAPDPGRSPDGAWSCPDCAALVMDPDRLAHTAWHEGRAQRQAADELVALTEEMGLYEKD